jgi:CheY-like chemotaxis protein
MKAAECKATSFQRNPWPGGFRKRYQSSAFSCSLALFHDFHPKITHNREVFSGAVSIDWLIRDESFRCYKILIRQSVLCGLTFVYSWYLNRNREADLKEIAMQRVLVVDDDRLVADTLSLIFAKSGFDARVAYSADEALDCAREFPPDLLLCDVTMPGRDGLALVADINHELPACRIIVLTAFYANIKNVHEQANKLARPLGILTKPCQPSELLREAASLLATA